jgi:hypothetical protein
MGGGIMEKTPGRPIESSPFRKTQLSLDAKIMAALIKLQPQTKEEICAKTEISDRTFYRIIAVLEKQKIIKCQDRLYSLWDFDFLEKKIEDALSKLIRECAMIYPDYVVNEVGKPWPEIQAATYKIVKKLRLTITKAGNQTVFLKIN